MRLLHTTKLHLVEFQDQRIFPPAIPPYAILSHTWAEEEVSFQDVQQGLAQSRRGYEKVAGACALAVQDGFEYLWIDTCCIDKSSSAELSEAINSMFRWYRDAEVCYAFLSDVDADEIPHSEAGSFRKARWFTRGWTLQELIAPGVVYFYGADWKQIGSRETLLDLIVDLTHISASYFTTGDLTQFSAAQKMSWAAGRKTTRVEDEAYSLLGLFDINMPLLYGEGERAFQRLQEEILRQTEDDSLFAHHGHDILAKSPFSFEGCADIARLDDSPYYQNPVHLLNRDLSFNCARITMTFPATQYTGFGEPPGSLLLAMLNCGTAEAPAVLVLRKDKDKPGIWSKMYSLTGEEALAALWSRCVKNRTVSVARAKRGGDRVWEWRAAYAEVDKFMSRFQDGDRVRLEPTMTPVVRPSPGLAPGLATAQDVLRDNIVVKGPGETSGFEVQYVYAVRFQARWLGQSDEVHLTPIYGEDQWQSCVVFSRAGGWSFMVTLRPTRASVNANLYTDIPPWKGENTLAYIEGLERDRRENKGEEPCCGATQRVDGEGSVVVEVQSRRRSNGCQELALEVGELDVQVFVEEQVAKAASSVSSSKE